MPRHVLQPLPRAFAAHNDPAARRQALNGDEDWKRMDRVQVLGGTDYGHDGCVNALSWSDDGSTLLSGSDDRRICIWGTDSSSSSSNSPHTMKLLDTIGTGHKANIFSAKFLPNASTPTIVSCAGDRDVRVYEVERLARTDVGRGTIMRDQLWGVDGAGVTVLKCHADRTKRIATENSPFLFLTVSEDGTVRQHDLRRPHRCRSECPEPLFHAPRNVDLYSLSVSTVAPHLFAVAGRTDSAFMCDRRMPERQTPSWGSNTHASGQVNCVRRLGLPPKEWQTLSQNSPFPEANHVTCVKMSPDHADEVICAFARHSTSLFSIYDSPADTSARTPSPAHSPSPHNVNPTFSPNSPSTRSSPRPPKRRHSEMTAVERFAATRPSPIQGENAETAASGASEPGALGTASTNIERASVADPAAEPPMTFYEQLIGDIELDDSEDLAITTGPDATLDALLVDEEDAGDLPEPANSVLDVGGASSIVHPSSADNSVMGAGVQPVEGDVPRELQIEVEGKVSNVSELIRSDLARLRALMEGDDDGLEEDDEDMIDEEDDFDGFDEDDEMGDEDFDFIEEADMDEDEDGEYGQVMGIGEFAGVDVVYPRRSYKGARNIETVKDCNFLGVRSDKVCSGSDDGNFFVWDKMSGRLDGIWEGDGHVVNVMEQHPTLPLVAVSGIDSTVKMFAPTTKIDPSFSRLHLRDSIIKANTARASRRNDGIMQTEDLLEMLARRGPLLGGDEDARNRALQQCATQ